MKFQLQIRQKHRRYLRKFRNCEHTFAPFDSNTEQHANFAGSIADILRRAPTLNFHQYLPIYINYEIAASNCYGHTIFI